VTGRCFPAALALACLAIVVAGPASAATFRVTTTRDDGDGSLRDAIERANGEPGSTIEVALRRDAVIVVDSALPAIEAAGTRLLGGGVTLREGEGCERPRHRRGCDGLVVEGPDVLVRDVRVAGFTFDGIGVVGDQARDVRLEAIEAVDNLDDGIGVSGHAGPVDARRCLLMGNGFRTKGKGMLVFAGSTATLTDSVVVANRDGVTVSDEAHAELQGVLIAASYDKGLGVSGASVVAKSVQVLASGRDPGIEGRPPNGDGVRVGLGGRAELSNCRVAGSDDEGLVLLDTSSAALERSVIESNRGGDVSVSPTARLTRR
jgi:hypothetical protein